MVQAWDPVYTLPPALKVRGGGGGSGGDPKKIWDVQKEQLAALAATNALRTATGLVDNEAFQGYSVEKQQAELAALENSINKQLLNDTSLDLLPLENRIVASQTAMDYARNKVKANEEAIDTIGQKVGLVGSMAVGGAARFLGDVAGVAGSMAGRVIGLASDAVGFEAGRQLADDMREGSATILGFSQEVFDIFARSTKLGENLQKRMDELRR
jgi:hypothetical protein